MPAAIPSLLNVLMIILLFLFLSVCEPSVMPLQIAFESSLRFVL